MSARRVVAALLAMMLGAAMISVLPGAPPADGAPADSAITKSGNPDGPFASLHVTVSQTQNLINQAITVTWKGGTPTLPVSGSFGNNYLQIMQCWGDAPGPDRTQCQYGASDGQVPPAGAWVRSRQVTTTVVDPNETLKLPSGNAFVPFWPVGKPKPTDAVDRGSNDFFDSQVTNEIPLARTHGDGTGLEFFEVQTVRQAAGLGCGAPVTAGGVTKGQSCWLVIVPRGSTEVDGSTRGDSNTDELVSSPLSLTNWNNRIVFPLDFLPVGQACPLGGVERRMIGHELAVDAVSSWQPALCAGGGTVYSYTQLGDEVARNLVLAGSSPGLALVTAPIPPDQAPPDKAMVYAPVGLSGLVIAFNIEHVPSTTLPDDVKLDGQRFTSMKLTPRLVAKLLTQSYRGAVAQLPADLTKNVAGLTVDPEFLALNPEYKGFTPFQQPPDALAQLSGSDVTSLLWSWVKADPEASKFLAGTPDEFGMVVNPLNKDLPLPTSTFPRNDQSCTDVTLGSKPDGSLLKGQNCTLDGHPFTNDMHDAGRSASRGDSQARNIQLGSDGITVTPAKLPRQAPGHRALLAVVDAATAVRYGLPTAALRNAAQQFVSPTAGSILAGEAAMKPSPVAGVLAADPTATDRAAYPLAALSYAVTSPSTLDAAAGKDYATFLRYAVGPGQLQGIEPGKLPLGMVPLPEALKAQAVAAAATIEAQAGKIPPGPPAKQPTSADGVPGGFGSPGSVAAGAGEGATATSPGGGSGALSPGAVPPGAGAPAATNVPSVAQQPVARVRRTPALPAPAVGALLLTILISGALAATSSPVLQSPVIHRLGTAIRRLTRKEVTPTEQ